MVLAADDLRSVTLFPLFSSPSLPMLCQAWYSMQDGLLGLQLVVAE